MPKTQLNCVLTQDLWDRLARQKQRTGVPKTILVHRALDAMLANLERQEQAIRAARQADADGRDHPNR
jgi:3-keto-L-gulonate-6-phosphate decarboxylase